MKLNFTIISVFCLCCFHSFAQPTFKFISSPSANIYSIVNDPTNANNMYACSGSNVLYSIDNGVSWDKTSNPTGAINTLYISPSGVLYAGTATGVYKYNKPPTNTWTAVSGGTTPLNVTTIIEDAALNLYAGTGTTGSILPNINSGTGIYRYSSGAWSTINTGITGSPLPYVKTFALLSGTLIAATYGNGVLKYNGSSWSAYGTGLNNLNVNCLTINSGLLFAGTDIGVSTSSGAAWTSASTNLTPNKPVRALESSGSTVYAGLGFYHYQKGNIAGEIYSTTNNGSAWTLNNSGFNSTSVLGMAVHNGTVFATSCGIWALSGSTWALSFTLNGTLKAPNHIYQLAHNSNGDLFAMCNNSAGNILGFGGMFRSTDGGTTWVSINKGINCQGLTKIFVDSDDNLWLGGNQLVGTNATYNLWGNPELYKSIDNGLNWVKNTSIMPPSTAYQYIVESPSRKLYVGLNFYSTNTNVASTTLSNLTNDIFDNTLTNANTPSANGRAYGLAVNSSSDVFLGVESKDYLLRSLANGGAGGLPGSFSSIITTTLSPTTTNPVGNNSVFIDPYTDHVFAGGAKGIVNGKYDMTIPANYKTDFGSIDNGNTFFLFNNVVDFTSYNDLVFTRNGIIYGILGSKSGPSVSGLYYSDGTFGSGTNFTGVHSGVSNFLYQFNSLMFDDCGYLYGLNGIAGSSIAMSNTILNAPGKCNLISPAQNGQDVLTPTFSWAHTCTATLNYTIEIATDINFSTIIKTVSNLSSPLYTYSGSPALTNNTTYYWRVNAINTTDASTIALGNSLWSKVYNFTANNPLPVKLLSFNASKKSGVIELKWVTATEINNDYYTVEHSVDGLSFKEIAKVKGAGNSSSILNYSSVDAHPYTGISYYRLKQADFNHNSEYSKVVAINFNSTLSDVSIYPNPNTGKFIINGAVKNEDLLISNSVGVVILKTRINLTNPQIDLSAQPNGTYFIKVSFENQSSVKKIVLNH